MGLSVYSIKGLILGSCTYQDLVMVVLDEHL